MTEIDELLNLWRVNNLSCRRIKEYLIKNVIDLDEVSEKLEDINETIKISLVSDLNLYLKILKK